MASPTSRYSSGGWLAGRQRGAQHDDHPFELSVGRGARPSTSARSSSGKALEAELDYPILFSQRGVLNLAHSLSDVRELGAAGEREPAPTASTPNGSIRRQVRQVVSDREHLARCALPGARRDPTSPAAAIAKHDYVAWGYGARRRCAGRRPDPELRSDRHRRHPRGARSGVAHHARANRRRADRTGGRRAYIGARGNGRAAAAFAEPARCRRWSRKLLEPIQPTVVMSNAVHVYVLAGAQGRAGDGGRPSRATTATAQRGSFHVIEAQLAAALELFPVFARGARPAKHGPGSSTVTPRCLADRRVDARRSALRQLWLGGRAASRATPGHRFGASRIRSPPVRPTPTMRRSPSTGSPRGALIDEHGRRGRGALMRGRSMQLIACPVVWPAGRGRVPLRAARPHVPYPADPAALTDGEWAQYVFFRDNPQGRLQRALGAFGRLPALVHRPCATPRATSSGAPTGRGTRPRTDPDDRARCPYGGGRTDRPQTAPCASPSTGVDYTGRGPATRWPRRSWPMACTRFSRSIKYGRPRGITAAGVEESSALVQVDAPYSEPMLTAPTIELVEGLVAHGFERPGPAADRGPTRPRYDSVHAHCELLVVGAGPAGLGGRA